MTMPEQSIHWTIHSWREMHEESSEDIQNQYSAFSWPHSMLALHNSKLCLRSDTSVQAEITRQFILYALNNRLGSYTIYSTTYTRK